MKNLWPYILGAAVIVILASLYFLAPAAKPNVTSFDECAAAGYPIMESYPERCAAPGGQTFTRDIGDELNKADLVKVTEPRPGEKAASPLNIQGEARGYWFFEASFPVKLFDEQGTQLAHGLAQAQGEWMTEDFVPFEATLNFAVPAGAKKGNLILEKDNPSGLPENADSFRVPVRF